MFEAWSVNQKVTQACIYSYDQLTHKMMNFNHEGNSSIIDLNLAEYDMVKEIKVWLSVFKKKKVCIQLKNRQITDISIVFLGWGQCSTFIIKA